MTGGQTAADIRAVLDEMAARYAAKDADGVVATLAGDDVVLVGTGADEVRFGLADARAQVERDMAQADELSFQMDNVRINLVGEAAFVYADVVFAGIAAGSPFEIPVRWTAGLLQTGDGWRFAQFHVSVPFGEQEQGESFPA